MLRVLKTCVLHRSAQQFPKLQTYGTDKEGPYIARNIEATRLAYDVADSEVQSYTAKTTLSAEELTASAESRVSSRLLDPTLISPAFQQLQQVRGYYTVPDTLDVDRYAIGDDPQRFARPRGPQAAELTQRRRPAIARQERIFLGRPDGLGRTKKHPRKTKQRNDPGPARHSSSAMPDRWRGVQTFWRGVLPGETCS